MSHVSTGLPTFDPSLVKYRDQMESILRWAEVGTWEWSRNDQTFTVNPEFLAKYAVTGIDPNCLTVDDWARLINPQDRDRVIGQFADLVAGKRTVFDDTYRLKTENGFISVHGRGGVVEYTTDGEPLRITGTIQDVTALRDVEEAILRRDRLLGAANESARILLSSGGNGFDQAVWKALDFLGLAAEVDRVYVWKNHRGEDGRLYTTQVYEWSLGAEPQQGNELTVGIAFDEAIPTWEPTLTSGRCINSLVRDMPQSEQEQLAPQGIVSILVAPIMLENEFWGFIGFDDCHQERVWSDSEEGILKAAGLLIASAMMRENTASALDNERLFFQQIIQASPVSIAVIRDGILLSANKRFHELCHAKPGESVVSTLVDLNDYREILKVIGNRGLIENFSTQIYGPDGAILDMLYTGLRIDHKGAPAVLSWLVDITHLKRIEKELIHARDLAESGTRAKSEFLARMSHEIRTPMNAVLGIAYLSLQTELTPQQHDYVTNIQTAAKNLLGIIDDILDFSKIEAGKMELERIPFNLAEVLHETTLVVEHRIKEKGLELIVQLQEPNGEFLLGDPLRLRQVLTNLLSNAVKFTEKGTVTIAVQTESVEPDFVALGFAIEDTGIGMTQEQLQGLFQSFSQADGSTTRRFGGTGLGLVITKNLIELMGGRIHVESIPGQGTVFRFQLQFPKLHQMGADDRNALLSKKRVLIVDDDHTALAMIKNLVLSFDMRADVVDSGREAITVLTQAAKEGDPYHIMLLDWKMPRMDGLETVRRIRTLKDVGNLPQILMVSAYDRSECIRQAQGLGLAGFIVKPISYSSIRDAIFDAFVSRAIAESGDEIIHDDRNDHVKGAKILLVEDNKINQMVATEMLKMSAVELTVVDDGQQAVDAVRQHDFDLVLMDVQMPIMDGLTATREIRLLDKPGIGKLPIIAMTAHAMDADYQRSIEAGMNDHLTKPIDPIKLRHALENWIVRK